MRTSRTRATLLAALAALALATPAAADLNHYIQITGATQGVFPGSGDIQPWEGYAVGLEYHHLLDRPTAGMATQHQTVISTITMDEPLIPHLMRAMETDESLTVTFSFLRPSGAGSEEVYSIVTLSGARVTSLEPLSPDDQDPALAAYQATVRVRYSYASIGFEHVPTADAATLVNSGN
jgi:type VI secretion system Hcp family effector